MVGAVIVCDGKVIAEGYHERFGGPHAEVNAINAVEDKDLLKRSRLFVNLEPCCHTGKTPPCTDLIIKSGIRDVVVGCRDVFEQVSGKGLEFLKKAGVTVTCNVLEAECR